MNVPRNGLSEFVERNRSIGTGALALEGLQGPLALLVEDDTLVVSSYLRRLGDAADRLLWAPDVTTARRLFALASGRLATIAFDYSVEDGNTLPLILEVKPKFDGPMIACSGDPSCRRAQMAAGCTLEADKFRVPALLKEYLQ